MKRTIACQHCRDKFRTEKGLRYHMSWKHKEHVVTLAQKKPKKTTFKSVLRQVSQTSGEMGWILVHGQHTAAPEPQCPICKRGERPMMASW